MSISETFKKGNHVVRSVLRAPTPDDFVFMTFAITYRCDSKCTMCNIWQTYKKNPDKYKEELSVNEIREAFGKSVLLKKTRGFIIAGGEPFLRRDFNDLILFLKELNPSATIIIASNGQNSDLIEDKLKFIRHSLVNGKKEDSVLYIGVSLDGTEETHDRMRGINGSYRNAMRTVEIIRDIDGMFPGFVFTFTPKNYDQFIPVLRLANEMRIPLTFQFVQTSGHYYDNKNLNFNWTREQISRVRIILHETRYFDLIRKEFIDYRSAHTFKDRLLSYNRYFLDYVLKYQLHQERDFDCYSGTHSCFLDPYGNVFPCISLDKSIGNIRKQNFDYLWTSPEADETRKHISQRQCHCCSFCDIPNSLPRNLNVITSNIKNMLKPG